MSSQPVSQTPTQPALGTTESELEAALAARYPALAEPMIAARLLAALRVAERELKRLTDDPLTSRMVDGGVLAQVRAARLAGEHGARNVH